MSKYKKYYHIPKENSDLRMGVVLKILFRAVGYPAYIFAWLLAFQRFLSQKNMSAADYVSQKLLMTILLSVFVLVSGLLIFRFWKLFGKRTYDAKIISTGFSNDYGAAHGENGSFKMAMKTNLVLKLQKENGKKKTIRVQLYDDGFSGYYQVGDTVVVHREINYPEAVETNRDLYICLHCGHTVTSDQADNGCPICERSIVKRQN